MPYPEHRKQKTIAERFWPKVKKTDGCWLWMGGKSDSGYGRFGLGTRKDGIAIAHRVAWELINGPIPEGMLLLHRCDTPSCVNPGHLFLGSQQENMMDCHQKKRFFNQRKTHCQKGHEFTLQNTHYNKNGGRVCRACDNERTKARYALRKDNHETSPSH